MKQINKTLVDKLKIILNCSENELMKKLVEHKCIRNYTDNNLHFKKNEFYYVLKNTDSSYYDVLIDYTIISFSLNKSKYTAYFYDYFSTEK